MCYPYEPDHIKHAFWSLLIIIALVGVVIAVTTYLRPSIEAQYQARCEVGNICPVGR